MTASLSLAATIALSPFAIIPATLLGLTLSAANPEVLLLGLGGGRQHRGRSSRAPLTPPRSSLP